MWIPVFPETRIWIELVKNRTKLIVRNVQDADEGKVVEETRKYSSRNSLQNNYSSWCYEEFKFDACIGGARRDEKKQS
jgi:sulfate adenylyltransferase subunit 2